MEKKLHLYISRKNPLIWLMTLCLVGSAAARIVIPCMKGEWGSLKMWSQIILPITATMLYVLIVLFSGKERFYRTALPVWLLGLCFAIRPHTVLGNNAYVLFIFCAFIFFYCLFYHLVTSGKLRFPWLIAFLMLISMTAVFYSHHQGAGQYGSLWHPDALLPVTADYLLFFGIFLCGLSVRIHADGKYHPTWGDRKDGRRLRTLPPMDQITSFFQVERTSCSNFFEESFEITHTERYIRQKRREGLTDFGINHVLLAAYVRGVAKYPQLNRFVSGQKVYSRGEDIQYCMVVKKEMRLDAPDTAIKVHLHPSDTAEDVYHKLKAAVTSVKATQELDSSLDSLMMSLNLLPSILLKFIVWLLKLLDYFGLLPKALLEISPFHGTLFFTSVGSLGIRPVYHHLYNFGNLPVFGAFGMKRRVVESLEDGTIYQKKYVDMKFTLDERICDGFTYATFFKYYRRLVTHPELLDQPPEEIVQDIP